MRASQPNCQQLKIGKGFKVRRHDKGVINGDKECDHAITLASQQWRQDVISISASLLGLCGEIQNICKDSERTGAAQNLLHAETVVLVWQQRLCKNHHRRAQRVVALWRSFWRWYGCRLDGPHQTRRIRNSARSSPSGASIQRHTFPTASAVRKSGQSSAEDDPHTLTSLLRIANIKPGVTC